jgi:hypothetical protein
MIGSFPLPMTIPLAFSCDVGNIAPVADPWTHDALSQAQ